MAKIHNSQSVSQCSHSVVPDSLLPHGLQCARPPCPSPTPRVYSNSCPLSRWFHLTISPSVVSSPSPPSRLQFFPASGSFQMSQFFTSGGQSIGVSASASVLPMNIQDWFPLAWTGWISLDWTHQMLARIQRNYTTHLYCWWKYKMAQLLWKKIWAISLRQNMQPSYIWPRNYTLGNFSQKNENYIQTKTHIERFTTVLFINAPNWKQPINVLPSKGGYLNKLVHEHLGILLSNKKESTTNTHSVLDGAQGSYAEWKRPISRWQSMWYHLYGSLLETENIVVAATMRGSVWQPGSDGTVLYLDCGGGYTKLHVGHNCTGFYMQVHTNGVWKTSKICALYPTSFPGLECVSWFNTG